jgi:putative tricarboxylic transport membrane protein
MLRTDDEESDIRREGRADASPGGVQGRRRPGEGIFALVLLAGSLALLWNAHGIAGFRSLSSPGAIPMATSAAMVLTAGIIAWRTWRLPRTTDESLRVAVFPTQVVVMVLMLVGYGLLLRPLGFVPTSALFLFLSLLFLTRRGVVFCAVTTVISVVVIWLVFRIVFTVLMPPGIVPEAQIIQFFRNLMQGGA